MRYTFPGLFLFLLAVPCGASELANHLLSDEEIATRCQASIRGKINLVQNSEGKEVTKCEQTYLTMREVAGAYAENEKAALAAVKTEPGDCEKSATQEGCLKDARALASKAKEGLESLAAMAEQGQVKLDELVPETRADGPSQ